MKCEICGSACNPLGLVFLERNHSNIPLKSQKQVEYYKCTTCFFVFCPELQKCTEDYFKSYIYNNEYSLYDPDYTGSRACSYARLFESLIHGYYAKRFKHLDYGCGQGDLSAIFSSKGINSKNYDPYSYPEKPSGLFNFITSIEAIEQSKNVDNSIKDMRKYLSKDGVILISTLLANESTSIDWDYILPRCGHISILSDKSIRILARNNGLMYIPISINLHILQPGKNNAINILGWSNGR